MGEENKDFKVTSAKYDNSDFTDMLCQMMFVPKPFGMVWSFDKMKEFLKFKGYKVIERVDDVTGRSVDVAIKPGAKYIPDATRSNIIESFEEEVQSTILEWLKKISK